MGELRVVHVVKDGELAAAVGRAKEEQRLRDQLDVDERHHQGSAGAETRAERGEERRHAHARRIEQLGPGAAFPQSEKDEHDDGRAEGAQTPGRQHRALRIGVVQPDHQQRQRQRQ